jgi:hypothetical protein
MSLKTLETQIRDNIANHAGTLLLSEIQVPVVNNIIENM